MRKNCKAGSENDRFSKCGFFEPEKQKKLILKNGEFLRLPITWKKNKKKGA